MSHPRNKRERLEIGNKIARKQFKESGFYNHMSRKTHPGHFGALRKTQKFCSNPFCCGNPRRIRGANNQTLKEVKMSLPDERSTDLVLHGPYEGYFGDVAD